MQQIYEQIKTPIKLGAVMKWDEHFTDSPTIFKKGDLFYMYFVAISTTLPINKSRSSEAPADALQSVESDAAGKWRGRITVSQPQA